MLKYFCQKPFFNAVLCFALSALFSCVGDNYKEQGDSGMEQSIPAEAMYKDVKLPIATRPSAWKGNFISGASAEVRNMQVHFDMEMTPVNKSFLPLSENKKDTFADAVFNIEIRFNGQPIIFDMPDPNKSWLKKSTLVKTPDNTLTFATEYLNLNNPKQVRLSLPLFVFSALKANSKGLVSIRVWQDYFLSKEKSRVKNTGPEEIAFTSYYYDTLKTKLIDNTYSFSLTVPQIYKTDIICDSIILQDDKNWSPGGSDHTLWKSSYPDIYFSLSDLYSNPQSSSHTEKSTAKFTLGDTLPFYHYSPSELFYITVYDYDVLSRDDALGEWKGELRSLKNNGQYRLQFGHIKPFFLRKKEFGQINK